MVEYSSCGVYIESATSKKDKLKRVVAIIDVLYSSALKAAATDNISEYSLDDGQVKIKEIYKGTESIMKAIAVLETQQQTLLNQLNGRISRSVDIKSFKRY